MGHAEPTEFRSALRFGCLTQYYDPIVQFTMRDREFKSQLLSAANLKPGMRVLDFGCGTGTLTLMAKRLCPGIEVVGLDIDLKILGQAKLRADRAGLVVPWIQGAVDETFEQWAPVDRVLTSLVLHHLTTEQKRNVLSVLHRGIKPGGEIHIVDFHRPNSIMMSLASQVIRVFDGRAQTEANLTGRLPEMIKEAGFRNVRVEDEQSTLFGTLARFRGVVGDH